MYVHTVRVWAEHIYTPQLAMSPDSVTHNLVGNISSIPSEFTILRWQLLIRGISLNRTMWQD